MDWSFASDVQSRLELFECEVIVYEKKSHEVSSRNLRLGMVLNGLDRSSLKAHLLLNIGRYASWAEFKQEIVNYRRAVSTVTMGGAAVADGNWCVWRCQQGQEGHNVQELRGKRAHREGVSPERRRRSQA